MTSSSLPSWNDGPVKSAIVDFVRRVTEEGAPDFVPPSARIATFDNDGTLWCEQPMQTQFFFAKDRLRQLVEQDPELASRQPFKAFLEGDVSTLKEYGKRGLFEIAIKTHAGLTERKFSQLAAQWFASARHPKLGRAFTSCVYQPQLELLDFLRRHGFKVFIVSGGGVDLIRAFAEDVYGIPPEQVIGSNLKLRVDLSEDRVELLKLPELCAFDDAEVKVENIALHIGRRPILSFGNSDGDLPMLRYAKSGDGPGLALLLHHDDADREVAYDQDFPLSPLKDALDRAEHFKITVVSMKRDWNCVFVDNDSIPSVGISGACLGGMAG
jgi:phosphoserine phosphatase